ncbi:ATP-dependent helicase [Oceanidesulfovibrio indonesiensis]|uniref:ATP-dependent helicase n=1 Tax=Oceanidesulfovibrio indonesiensis TaxID=54767 RepID=A0A7M3MCK5_9BACT|nr:ATP-dependent helicase [Oceanidesulfovibrio indonesiensis]
MKDNTLSFQNFDLGSTIEANIRDMGFTEPTPIQSQAIPAILDGKDVMGLAQTGTGKTAAFVLPILKRFSAKPAKAQRGVRHLVLAPTRELAEQIHENAIALGRNTGMRSVSVYGGVGMQPQINKLRAGYQFVAACPGRLLDHIQRGNIDLSKLETLVLDEADHMFDMGFLPTIRKILEHLPKNRQNLLFSATMPKEIESLARDILCDPVTVRVGQLAPAETVSHEGYHVADHHKTRLLMDLLPRLDNGSVLVFTRTKHRAKQLAQKLEKSGHKSASLQGNLSQNRRKEAIDGFRDGAYRVLVATDIAARGIDISRVTHVVNFDVPDTPEAYTHRIGRTGRASRTGCAHTLITRKDTYMIRSIERLLGAPINRCELGGFDYTERNSAPGDDMDNRQPRNNGPRENKGRPARSGDRPYGKATGGRSNGERAYGKPRGEKPGGGRPSQNRSRPQNRRGQSASA